MPMTKTVGSGSESGSGSVVIGMDPGSTQKCHGSGILMKTCLNHILGSVGEPERVEPEHEQADGPRHEDHSPHQQGGDGQF
jgi:hypothetical protein